MFLVSYNAKAECYQNKNGENWVLYCFNVGIQVNYIQKCVVISFLTAIFYLT